MGILNLFRRKKVEDEAASPARMLQTGRITDGVVFDIGLDESGAITHVFYSYNIGGVEYQSSQVLTPEQRFRPADYAPGARVTVRYNPRQPSHSIVL